MTQSRECSNGFAQYLSSSDRFRGIDRTLSRSKAPAFCRDFEWHIVTFVEPIKATYHEHYRVFERPFAVPYGELDLPVRWHNILLRQCIIVRPVTMDLDITYLCTAISNPHREHPAPGATAAAESEFRRSLPRVARFHNSHVLSGGFHKLCSFLYLSLKFQLLCVERLGVKPKLLAVLKVPDHQPEQSEWGGCACEKISPFIQGHYRYVL